MPIKLLFISTLIALGASAHAIEKKDPCIFVTRKEVAQVLMALPPEVIGWANCSGQSKDANIFIISEFKKPLDVKPLEKYLLDYARLAVESGTSSRVTKNKIEKSGAREIVVETKRLRNMEPTLHFAFTSNPSPKGQLVFVHSMGRRQTQTIKTQLNELRLILTGPQFLEKIKKP